MAGPTLTWDLGTAYDLFISLYVLHNPDKFGLRGSWAAGVRSRLPLEHRRMLEESCRMFGPPLHWVYRLDAPKDSAVALAALRRLPPGERLPALALAPDLPREPAEFLQVLARRGAWRPADRETWQQLAEKHHLETNGMEGLTAVLDGWTHAAEFGERYLEALQAYIQVFFAEEEAQLAPVLGTALRRAQELAADRSIEDLIEALSQGLHIPMLLTLNEITLAPSYWMMPLIYKAGLSPGHVLIAYGARPPGASLVPGETVPDTLLRSLKALADPTRLRILRFLAHEPLTPAELARRLRLRPPTVIHHLHALRLAGLVNVVIQEPDERRYTARLEAVHALGALLDEFIAAEK